MRIIVDECLPNKLCKALIGHDAILVQKAGFSGYKDKALLDSIEGSYDVFITIDNNLSFQQNLNDYQISIVVLHALTNAYEDIESLIPDILLALGSIKAGGFVNIPNLK